MKQGGRLPPEKKRKTKICRFLYENIRSGFFVEEKMSRITIVHLNEKFFEEHAQHVEILKKPKRPHLVLILKIAQGTFAIPFRTSAHRPKTGRISHCFFFVKSGRKSLSTTGRIPALDFAKAVIVTEDDIGDVTRIDANEFKELQDHFREIETKFLNYLRYYVNSIKTQTNLDAPEIKYSSLQYFMDTLVEMDLEK
jgi:hypothetical protein